MKGTLVVRSVLPDICYPLSRTQKYFSILPYAAATRYATDWSGTLNVHGPPRVFMNILLYISYIDMVELFGVGAIASALRGSRAFKWFSIGFTAVGEAESTCPSRVAEPSDQKGDNPRRLSARNALWMVGRCTTGAPIHSAVALTSMLRHRTAGK